MSRMKTENVRLNTEKLKYRRQEVKFAGYIISSKGSKADPEKIRAISEMAAPGNIPDFRRFVAWSTTWQSTYRAYQR